MAVEQTQVLPAPVLEAALTAFTKKLPPLMGQQINTGAYAPQVAAQTALQTGASQAAQGLGALTGPQAYQPYMSPYQQEVMDATLSEFDRQQTINQQGLRDQAIGSGAYGGARQGIMQQEYMNQGALNRAQLQAGMLNDAFMQAQQAAGTDLAARQGLGQYQQALGQADQGFEQAKLDATTLANREKEFEEFTRLGLVGQQLAQIQPGAFPTTTIGYQQSAAPASPMASFLGGAAGAGGVLGKLGIFG